MAKKLVPIILSTAVWGTQLHRSQVCYRCDNSSVVAALSKGLAHDVVVMQLLHCLVFYDIHVVGSKNVVANHLSHNNLSSFSPPAHRPHRFPYHSHQPC